MTDGKLKLGILGITDTTRLFLESARDTDKFWLTAIADEDMKRAETFSATLGCDTNTDFRQFILKNKFDLLIISEETNEELDIVMLALENGTSILKIPPFARNLTEAADIYETARSNNTFYTPANILKYSPGFHSLTEYIKDTGKSNEDYYQAILQSYSYTDTEE